MKTKKKDKNKSSTSKDSPAKSKSAKSTPSKLTPSKSTPQKSKNSLPQIYHPKKGPLFPKSDTNTYEEETTTPWYDEYKDLSQNENKNPLDQTTHYRKISQDIYSTELKLHTLKRKTSKSEWIQSTMKQGTLKDRIAAMSITASDDPLHESLGILDDFLGILMKALREDKPIHIKIEYDKY